jgi:thioredoxin 2
MESTSPHIVCPHCLSINRVPQARLADDPVCGKCGNALLDGKPATLTDANFDRITTRTELPIVVDFWATWCGPCISMAPHFERAASQLKGQVLFAKVDSDANPQLSGRFGIRSIPTMVRLLNGNEVARQTGALQASQIVSVSR